MAKLKSLDPATGEVVGAVETSTKRAVQQAVAHARDAQPLWAATPVADRVGLMRRFVRIVLDDRADAAHAITRETGKPLVESHMADLLPTLDQAAYLVRHGESLLRSRRFRLWNPLLFDRRSETERRPLGVAAVIAPWNYPLGIPAAGVLPALVAGNAVMLKPSEETPLIAERLARWLSAAGLPANLLHVVHGGPSVGKALIESDVDGVAFTGSVGTGRKVAAATAERFIPCTLELGGKDPMLVLADARPDLAVGGALWGGFTNAGQTCASVERVYAHEAIHKEILGGIVAGAKRLRVGPGTGDVDMGPVIHEAAARRILAQVRDAEKRGATIETGGHGLDELGPCFVAPTVLSGVTHEMGIMCDETFGPVLPVIPVQNDDEAIGFANASPFGLTASIWSRDKRHARMVADKVEAGTVTINDCVYTYAAVDTPWGGVKSSGRGTSHAAGGLLDWTRLRHVNLAPADRNRSPWYFPYDQHLHRLMERGLPFLYGGAKGKRRTGGVATAFLRRR